MSHGVSPSFEQSLLLCEQVSSLTQDDPSSLERLSLAINAGWTPFLHDFILRSRILPPVEQFFSHNNQLLGLFKIVQEAFPSMSASYPLLRRCAPGQKRSIHNVMKIVSSSPWYDLDGGQRTWLIQSNPELLAPDKNLKYSESDHWLMTMVLVLLPKKVAVTGAKSSAFLLEPFHGYFNSLAWSSLSSSAPSLAHRLACLLCCVASLDHATASWQSTASEQALALSPHAKPLEGVPGLIATVCVAEQFARDQPERLMPMMTCLGSNPLQAEAFLFSSWTVQPLMLSDVLTRSNLWRDPWSEKNFVRKFKEPLDFTNLYSEPLSTTRPIDFAEDVSKLPLFTLSALFKASRCWEALASLYEPPFSMTALALHRSKIPSLVEIKKRMERHTEAAQDGLSESLAVLKKNLSNEADRARRMLTKLPLPAELMADLLGLNMSEVSGLSPEALSFAERFDEQAADMFKHTCEQAHRKIKSGQSASIKLPLNFDWMSMSLMMGALPSFFKDKAPPGSIARACSFMDHASALGINDYLNIAECALVESDELAIVTLQSISENALKARPKARL